MIQCQDCEHFVRGPDGQVGFRCDPFATIKEPECLVKWQLIKVDQQLSELATMVRAYKATLDMYRRLAPLQEKMFRHMEREIDEVDEADSWKQDLEDDDDDSAEKRDT
jgi:hypothetical protein